MDFKDTILQFSERISKLKDSIGTEEATKNAFVMPLLNALGYDVFNPMEVMPEFTCDIGTKKGEKIDYAIMKDGKPILLIECKHWANQLTLNDNQLLRYFHVSEARFGVLTNGIEYRFYTDIDKNNVMDEKPFLVVDLLKLTEAKIEQLKYFHKSYFNENEILSTAAELKISNDLKNIVKKEFFEPSGEFVRFFVKAVNGGYYSNKQIEQYTPLVKKSIQNYINDVISERLSVAIENNKETTTAPAKEEPVKTEELAEGVVSVSDDGKVVTMQEELDGYNIIRSILRRRIDVSRLTYKDFQSYFVVNIDDNSWYWVCRLFMGKRKKQIGFPMEDYKGCDWVQIEKLDDIFKYEDRLIECLNRALSLMK